jgi:hypothetical protein
VARELDEQRRRHHRVRWWSSLAGAALVATVPAACSSSSSTSPGSSTSTPPTTTATGPVRLAACDASDLHLTLPSEPSAATGGQLILAVGFRNDGDAPCQVQGYPTVTILGPDGRPDPVRHNPNSPPGSTTEGGDWRPVRLEHGEQALAWIDWVVHTPAGTPCPMSRLVAIGPPGSAPTSIQPVEVQTCDPVEVTALGHR